MPPDRSLRIARDVALALKEAQVHGVIHRDIKPENILLDSNGIVKVNDFGVAKQTGSTSLTVPGGFVGSLAYASPEHATGQTVDKSDVYSLGATLYNMLTGTVPFQGDFGEIMRKHREEPLPEAPLDGLPESVKAIVRRCMAKAPEDRYTAQELITDIDAALSDVAAMQQSVTDGALAETLVDRPDMTLIAPIAAELRRTRTLNPLTWFGGSRFELKLRNGSSSDQVLDLEAQTENRRATVVMPHALHVPAGGSRTVPVRATGFPRVFVRRQREDPASRFTISVTSGDGSPPASVTTTAGGSWLPYGGLALLVIAPVVALAVFGLLSALGDDEDAAAGVLASPSPTPLRTSSPTPSPLPDLPVVTRVNCPTTASPGELQCFAGVNGTVTLGKWDVDGSLAADEGTQLTATLDSPGVHIVSFSACNQDRCSEPVSVAIAVTIGETPISTPSPAPTQVAPPPTPVGGCQARPPEGPPGVELAPGCAAVTLATSGLYMRDAPGINGANPRLLSPNSVVCIIGSPTEQDGVTWWQVRRADGVTGWSADENPRALGEVLLIGRGEACTQ